MTAWAFCEDCSWTTTAGSVDVAGDGGRHAGTRNHVVRTGGSGAQDGVEGPGSDARIGSAQGDHRADDSGLVPQNGETA